VAAKRGCRCCSAVLSRAVVQALVQIEQRKREKRASEEAIALVAAMQEAALKAEAAEAMEAAYVSLVQRVSSLGLGVENVEADGNCIFRALARLTRYAGGHRALRLAVAAWLEGPGANFQLDPHDPMTRLQNYLAEVSTPPSMVACASVERLTRSLVLVRQGDQDWGAYCRRMAQDREWGGPIELIAAAHVLRRPIVTFSSVPNFDEQVSFPSGDGPFEDPLAIGHVGGVHYVALVPEVRSIVKNGIFTRPLTVRQAATIPLASCATELPRLIIN
jgi:hypothetical protein